MTKEETKQKVSAVIVKAFLLNNPNGLKIENINRTLQEKKITKNQIKATIRCGNASYLFGSDTELYQNTIPKIMEWCNLYL